ncbi:aminotransferase class V-fold PLP-dependent enzyme [Sphingosinicella sp. BN140058]|uniref:aminotransferase class V-fold PLP-dependent enzyme n=1 Tax=Sphingosinicella sp. BN140058 TaxID=1892855 RepID=UPI0010128268|nr:aminotransferase class V-fold PLP-dependent enzyme [Sphingosinicella sp. BN140058]QAY76175.1 aminotransferase class V-fold PLP-dependent enzyme [Sphingosinicella sp. BN140058]
MPLIPCQRARFEIPAEIAYFDCAKMSPLLIAAAQAGEEGLRRKSRPWEINAASFFDEAERVRGLYARLIGARADDIAIIPSVSYGMATALRNLPVTAGQTIVTLADDFPSGIYAARALAQQAEAKVVTVPRPEGDGDWSAALLDAIDGSTALVVSPHVHWIHGTRIDVEAIARRCRSVGAALVLDTTQSMGALPLDLAAVDPDYMIAASYKWLLGPYSVGFLYVSPRHQGGRPLEEGWITRKGAEDFRSLAGYSQELEPSARRFDMGERSNFALLPVAGAAIAQLLDWGVANISEALGAITGDIAGQLADHGIEALPGRAPHFLSVRYRAGMPEDIEARLAAANVHVSLRGDTMRITPHLYNDDADVARLVAQLSA